MAKLGFALGNIFRETGIALERMGMRMQGDYSFLDPLTRHTEVRAIFEKKPIVGKGSFIAPSASVVGSVTVGSNTNIWYGAVVRGDAGKVKIGDNTNVKENAVLACSSEEGSLEIGNNVSVGSGVFIGAAKIEDNVSIGSGAKIADGAQIQKGAAIAGGSIVISGTVVPAGQLFAGTPAKAVRSLTADESAAAAKAVAPLTQLAAQHLGEINKLFKDVEKDKASWNWNRQIDRGIDAELGLLHDLRPEVFH